MRWDGPPADYRAELPSPVVSPLAAMFVERRRTGRACTEPFTDWWAWLFIATGAALVVATIVLLALPIR